jgi:hypothetical protein
MMKLLRYTVSYMRERGLEAGIEEKGECSSAMGVRRLGGRFTRLS